MEHLGVVIPPSAFVNATFDLKQLAALAATSTNTNNTNRRALRNALRNTKMAF
jgi:hypothetical protein